MEFVYILITLLLAIVVADVLGKIFKSVPSIFFAIAIGVAISYLPVFQEVDLNVELVMLLIIKPLIFSEAQKLSIDQVKKNYKAIFSLSMCLMFVTLLVTARMVHAIYPKMPAVFTLILIAMVIPTNTTILESVSKNLKFPHNILHILEGESLFNECIAVLIFDLALVAIETSHFQIRGLAYEFVASLIGGLIIGFILGSIIIMIRGWLETKNFESPAMMVSIQVITPFIVYSVAAKVFHVSGILAVIVAGMLHSIEKPMLNIRSTKLQIISDSTWDFIHYVLDGFVAIYLGLILRSVISNLENDGAYSIPFLIALAIVIYLVTIGVRFVWVILQPVKFQIVNSSRKKRIEGAAIYALSAVHGTVTLLIALSIPVLAPYPEMGLLRQEIILVVSIIILLSIIVPSIVFPIMLPKKQKRISPEAFEEVKKEVIYYAIFELESTYGKKDENVRAVTNILRKQLAYLKKSHFKPVPHDEIEKLLIKATEIELEAVEQLVEEGKISRYNGTLYQAYIIHANKNDIIAKLIHLRLAFIRFKMERNIGKHSNKKLEEKYQIVKDLKIAKHYGCNAVLDYLKEEMNNENYEVFAFVKKYYKKKNGNEINEFDTDSKKAIKKYVSKAFRMQHIFIQDQIEKGLISSALGDELIESLSYDEMIYYKSLD